MSSKPREATEELKKLEKELREKRRQYVDSQGIRVVYTAESPFHSSSARGITKRKKRRKPRKKKSVKKRKGKSKKKRVRRGRKTKRRS